MPLFQQILVIDTLDSLNQPNPYGSYPFVYDTASQNNKIEPTEITETFLQQSSLEMFPLFHAVNQIDWFLYLLLFFLTGIAITWYFIPERLVSIFTFFETKESFQSRERNIPSPGLVIRIFFFLNYFITLGIFIFLVIEQLTPDIIDNLNKSLVMIYTGISILLLFVYRGLYIVMTGFLFNTKNTANKQLNLYLNVDNALGVLLIPVILLIILTNADIFIYLGLFAIVIAHLFRWLQTFFIGKSAPGYSVLHLFMYLCTLEIIPLFILIKLLQFYTL